MKLSARVIALGLGAALLVSGCSMTNQITTQKEYAAGEGVNVDVGPVRALNIQLFSRADADAAVLFGALYNSAAEPAEVSIAVGAEVFTFEVGADEMLFLHEQELVTQGAEFTPGLISRLRLAVDAHVPAEFDVLVLDDTLPQYAEIEIPQLADSAA